MIDLIREVHPNDTMCDAKGVEEYLRIGKNALGICVRYLNGKIPSRIMDFPSGYGRVLRYLRNQWPGSRIFAVDTDSEALLFVKETFNVQTVLANPDLQMTIPNNIDLIFSGSLLTHFDDWQWARYLKLCTDALSDNGVFIFTTHGRIAALLAREQHPIYGDAIDTKALYERYQCAGFAFEPYSADYPTFGLSLASPSWMMKQIEQISSVKIIGFEEGGWGQDVIAVKHNPWPMI